jgi:hypothetical protein
MFEFIPLSYYLSELSSVVSTVTSVYLTVWARHGGKGQGQANTGQGSELSFGISIEIDTVVLLRRLLGQ